jgi:predicted RNA polymerase sigma factor
LPSVRGDLLAKLGRADEAATEFERAALLTRNAPERELLLERANMAGRRKAGRGMVTKAARLALYMGSR